MNKIFAKGQLVLKTRIITEFSGLSFSGHMFNNLWRKESITPDYILCNTGWFMKRGKSFLPGVWQKLELFFFVVFVCDTGDPGKNLPRYSVALW